MHDTAMQAMQIKLCSQNCVRTGIKIILFTDNTVNIKYNSDTTKLSESNIKVNVKDSYSLSFISTSRLPPFLRPERTGS